MVNKNKIKNIIKSNIEKIRISNDFSKRQIIIKETYNLFNKYFSVEFESYIGKIPTGNFITKYTEENLYSDFVDAYDSTPIGIENF
jgi:hypothetical protein